MLITTPMDFNGLCVTGLNDSSNNILQGVSIVTNMAGWDSSRLSFGSDNVFFDWKGLSFDPGTYLTATLDFGGGNISSVPEPSTLLLIGSGLVGLAGMRRRFKA